jgi:hypothetical protein
MNGDRNPLIFLRDVNVQASHGDHMNKNTQRSVLAVVAGFVAIAIPSTLTDIAMEKML